jgi:hypothetical protein
LNFTNIRVSGSRSWISACALALVLTPLVGRGADWQMSGNDLTSDRNQAHETLIDVGNVATLKPAWTFKMLGSVSATPLVTGGYVYVPDWGGGLHKLNARTGEVAWSRKVSEYTGWSDSVSRTTPVLADGVLVVAQQPQSFGAKHVSSYLLGLNPETGDFLWKVMLDKHPATTLTQSPVVYNGVIYIGTSSNEEHWATDTKYECCTFFAISGNFLSNVPDTVYSAHAMERCKLTVHVSTKLNRSHLITGERALILPCLGRTEEDIQGTGKQFLTIEDSMGIINPSQGFFPPASGLADRCSDHCESRESYFRVSNVHELAWLCGRLQPDPRFDFQGDSGFRELQRATC